MYCFYSFAVLQTLFKHINFFQRKYSLCVGWGRVAGDRRICGTCWSPASQVQ